MTTINLHDHLPLIVPKAIAWAQEVSLAVSEKGECLSEQGILTAKRVGVKNPELVRVATVNQIPTPSDPLLFEAASATGLFSPYTTGLTLGHSIFIVAGCMSKELIAHELRHVFQYENAGSIAKFLPLYLKQLADFGYHDAPFEIDARAYEH
jgi:hypothetical protein